MSAPSHLMQTSYLPIAGVSFPTAGACRVTRTRCTRRLELPAYVRIGSAAAPGTSAGYLGPVRPVCDDDIDSPAGKHSTVHGRGPVSRSTDINRLHPVSKHAAPGPSDLQLYADASRMILSPQMEAFDLRHEPDSVRDAYGWQPTAAGAMGRRGSTSLPTRRRSAAASSRPTV